jgi:hypothetical protein
MTLPATAPGRALLAARAALGLSTLLTPRLASRAFGLDPAENPQLPVLGRMWGVRNLAISAGMAGASGANRAAWWRVQPAIDVLDLAVIGFEWRRGAVPGVTAGLMAGAALTATVLGGLAAPAEA